MTRDHVSDGTRAAPQLGDAMSRVARQLQDEHGDVEGTLQAITASAITTVPDADECGISYVVRRGEIEPRASSGELPRLVDALQQRLGQGPCLDAAWDEQVVRVDDVRTDGRWPEFSQEAVQLGVGSMLCFQLFVAGDRMGALNLYARRPRAFGDESEDIGLVYASHAAVALAGAVHEHHLRAGMANRDVIGQAKGILMERHKLTAPQAFAVLARVSQELNRRLVDIAIELTDTGAVPGRPRRRDPEASPRGQEAGSRG